MADANFTNVSGAEPYALIESNEVLFPDYGGNVNGEEIVVNVDIELMYTYGNGWTEWVAYSAGQLLAPFPQQGPIVKIRTRAIGELGASKVVTLEDIVVGFDSFIWTITTRATADVTEAETNIPFISPAYPLIDFGGDPISFSENCMISLTNDLANGNWSTWTNYTANVDIIPPVGNWYIRFKMRSPVSYNASKLLKVIYGGDIWFTWSISTKAGIKAGNVAETKFTSLPPGTYANPPTGWRKPTGLMNSQVSSVIHATNGYTTLSGNNSAYTCWIRNVNMPTDKPFRVSAKFTQNATTPARNPGGGGLAFSNSAQTKLFTVEVINAENASRSMVVKTFASGLPTVVATQYFKLSPGLMNFILEVYYDPVTGIVQATLLPPTPVDLADKITLTTQLPNHLLIDNAGVVVKNASHSMDDFEIGHSLLPLRKGFQEATFDITTRAVSGKVYNGFVPKYGSYGAVPLDNIVVDGNGNLTANLVALDDLIGSTINPFLAAQLVDTPWVAEKYVELLSDDAAVYSAGSVTGTNYFLWMNTAFSNPPDGNFKWLGNHIAERNNVFIFQMPPLIPGNTTRWTVGFHYQTGEITAGLGGPDFPPNQDVTVPVYILAQGNYIKKFIAEISGTGVLTSFTEVTSSVKKFFNKFNAEYDTLYESNVYTIQNSGGIAIEGGQYSLNSGEWTSDPGFTGAGATIKVRGRSKKKKDRTTVVTVTLPDGTEEFTIRCKLSKQYEIDLSKSTTETVLEMVTYQNDLPLSESDLEITRVSNYPIGKNTEIVVKGKGSSPFQGSVTLRMDRVNLNSFGALDEPELFVDSNPTPTEVVAAFNLKYGTNLTVADFNFSQAFPVPDLDGEVYNLKPIFSNPLYNGSLNITLKLEVFNDFNTVNNAVPSTEVISNIVNDGDNPNGIMNYNTGGDYLVSPLDVFISVSSDLVTWSEWTILQEFDHGFGIHPYYIRLKTTSAPSPGATRTVIVANSAADIFYEWVINNQS